MEPYSPTPGTTIRLPLQKPVLPCKGKVLVNYGNKGVGYYLLYFLLQQPPPHCLCDWSPEASSIKGPCRSMINSQWPRIVREDHQQVRVRDRSRARSKASITPYYLFPRINKYLTQVQSWGGPLKA